MQNLPVMMNGYKLTVVEPPTRKMRQDERGNLVPANAPDGTAQFVVSLFAKLQVQTPGQRVPKGEEIKVTLTADPGPEIVEDMRVELIDARVSPYEVRNGDRVSSGISFKAVSVTPWTGPNGHPMPAPVARDK